ncbi:MAG: putative cation/proton antiporter YbaL [Gemmatimonadaceae bacterium]|nr:putative cation/proton antiporter YbaL [Gemmatimonadaceae bacterium]
MQPSVTLVSTLAAALGLALIFGFVAARLKLPPIVGYLVAGIVIGPATPGFDADVGLASQLAEIGAILLMFGVGLHFSVADLLNVRRMALPGAIVQILFSSSLGVGVALLWGWGAGAGIVFGLSLSVASTVVLVRALEDQGVLESVNGRIAVGWLVVEDLATVLALVLLPALADSLGFAGNGADARGIWLGLGKAMGRVAVFIALMMVIGRRLFPWMLWQVARTGSRELFTLCVIAAAVGIAHGSAHFFGVSFALGAFFAGMVLRESALSYRAAGESLPLRDAFSVLFFVSVGMLFDPAILIEQPLRVLTVGAIVMLGKSLAAFTIVLLFRYPLNTALTVSASLAQIGEFSFILAGLGVSLGLLPEAGQNLVLAAALFSIALNPLVFRSVEPMQNWIRKRSELASALERRDDPLAELPSTVSQERLTGHTLLAGYGLVGRRIAEALAGNGLSFVVAEQNRELVERLRARGWLAVSGDASDPAVLIQGHVVRARMLVIATPDAFRARQMIETARILNPGIEIVVRTHSEEGASLLAKEKMARVFVGEHELAKGMIDHVLGRLKETVSAGRHPDA